MNIAQIKVVSWTAAALLTLGLGAYVWSFVSTLEVRRALPDAELVRQRLSQVEPVAIKNDGQIKYDDVRRLFHDLNWTGAVKVVAQNTEVEQRPTEPQVVPIRDLIRVLWVQVDLGSQGGSSVFLKYKPKAQVENKGLGGFLLREGDTLARPHDGTKIESITAEGVTFSFTDPDRAKETLFPAEFDAHAQIVKVGADGVALPSATGRIPVVQGRTFTPGKTTALGRDRYVLGTEDMQLANDNYLDFLSQDVNVQQHRDPRTGRYDGIELNNVKAGSFVERHGATNGDVVKSINGHPVNSTSEAINFVKMNKDKYSTWEVVIENKGKTKTVTYQSPNN